MQLISIVKEITADGRRGRFAVEIGNVSEEARRVLIAGIEDRQQASLVEFRGYNRFWKCFYVPEEKSFRMVSILELSLTAPQDMDVSGIGCYVLDLIG